MDEHVPLHQWSLQEHVGKDSEFVTLPRYLRSTHSVNDHLHLSELQKHAIAVGASSDEVEKALDDERDPKAALIALVHKMELAPQEAAASMVRSLASSSSSHGSGSGSGSGHGSSNCWGTSHSAHELSETLAFCFFTFVMCNVCHHCNLAFFNSEWRFPISVVMFIAGMLIGVFFLYRAGDKWFQSITFHSLEILTGGMQDTQYFDPHALLYIVLPPLLYESASSMTWHVLTKIMPSALLLAVPGVMFNTFLTGFYIKGVIRMDGYEENDDESPTWAAAWLLASILSATDPVAVVAALASLGAPAKLSALVEGESLLNDGSAVVLCYVFRDWVMDLPDSAPQYEKDQLEKQKACPGNSTNISYGCTVLYFIQVAAGGAALGIFSGFLLYYWVKYSRKMHDDVLQLGIVLTFVYVTFYVAEAVKMSGVLATVTLGFVMTLCVNSRLSPGAHHAHHATVHQIAHFCNQITFFAAGVISARFMWGDTPCSHTGWEARPWFELAGLYIFVHLTRSTVILVFWPFLKKWGYGITWKEAVIMVYGGLRGAVGLIMGLIIEHNHYINPLISQMIVFHTSGIVLLTLFINGQTIDNLYKKLEIYPANSFREQHLKKVLIEVEEACQKQGIRKIAKDWFFDDCCFDVILQCVPNFGFITFDQSNSPVPEGIEPVHRTLKRLLLPGVEYRKARAAEFEDKKSTIAEMWEKRCKAGDDIFKDMVSSTREIAFKKDQAISVHAVLQTVDFNTDKSCKDGTGSVCGLYCSGFSMKSLMKDEDDMSFDIEILDMEDTEVIIGFFADDHNEPREVYPSDESQLLGMQENTIGFNCERGEVLISGPSCDDGCQLEMKPLQHGAKVSMIVERSLGNWQLDLRVNGEVVKRIIMGAFTDDDDDVIWGPFTPDQLYPAVEFRPKAFLNRKFTKTGGTGTGSSSGVFGGSRSGAPNISSVASNFFGSGKHVLEAVTAGFKSHEGDEETLSQDSGGNARPKVSNRNLDKPGFAKIVLNFETRPASDLDSVREVFHVFFNMTRNHYEEMHHHGVLCDLALHWLLQCTAEAVDSANGEVNAKTIWQYFDQGIMKNTSAKNQLMGMVNTVKNAIPLKRMSACSTDSIKSENLYQPILVSYLVLRQHIVRDSVFDKAPLSWKRVRAYAYQDTRGKVESLWAFIEAHEHCLHSSQVVERFPQLVKCIQEVLIQAKLDLENLELVSPGRFFYCKHLLALRTIMNRRLKKLDKFIRGGSLSAADGERLQEHFLERLTIVDFYTPQSMRIHDPNDPRMKAGEVNHHVFAWSHVEMPKRRPIHKLGQLERPDEAAKHKGDATPKKDGFGTSPRQNKRRNTRDKLRRPSADMTQINSTLRAINDSLSPEMTNTLKIPGEVPASPMSSPEKEKESQGAELSGLRDLASVEKIFENQATVVTIPEAEERPDSHVSHSIDSVGSVEVLKEKGEDDIEKKGDDPSTTLLNKSDDGKADDIGKPHSGWTPLSLEPQERVDDGTGTAEMPPKEA